MKKMNKLIALLLVLCTLVGVLASCDFLNKPEENPDEKPADPVYEHVDYVSELKIDLTSNRKRVELDNKNEAAINLYIDGDTTHFKVGNKVSHSAIIGGVLKARYLVVDTPESTGVIEEWGKDASDFTRSKLESAESIILESNDTQWNTDSNKRVLVWVWYKPAGAEDYRNLNVELIQAGFALWKSDSTLVYNKTAQKAQTQARREKLYIHGPEGLDEDFPYGEPTAISMTELRLTIEERYYQNVHFEAIVAENYDGSVYLEAYDEELGMYFGIPAYYQTAGLSGKPLEWLSVGNKVKIVGVITYFEGGDVWQITDLDYNAFEPDNPKNLALVEQGDPSKVPYTVKTPAEFFSNVTVTYGGKTITKKFYEFAECTSIAMDNLSVISAYTTSNGGDNDGAMTLRCQDASGNKITIRTGVLKKADKTLLCEDDVVGKTIDIKGIVEMYDGEPQIKVSNINNIVIK